MMSCLERLAGKRDNGKVKSTKPKKIQAHGIKGETNVNPQLQKILHHILSGLCSS